MSRRLGRARWAPAGVAVLAAGAALLGPGAALAGAAPTAAITLPPSSGGVYGVGQSVLTNFNCADPLALTGCADDNGGSATIPVAATVATGTGMLNTTAPGPATYTVTATGTDGQTQTPLSYTVALPTATIAAPAGGQTYAVGQSVPTSFSCGFPADDPDPATCTDSNGVNGGGGALDTSSAGAHTYTVTAQQSAGTGTATVNYIVVADAPRVAITAPVDNADYSWESVPNADYSCAPAPGTSLSSCTATIDGGPISSGQALPASLGSHTLTVTAADADGKTATRSVSYQATLTLVPPVSITAPTQGARYPLGTVVRAAYACGQPASGPALISCIGTVPGGRPIDTRTLGVHSFNVAATDAGGQSASEQVTYTVIPTTNRFRLTRVRTGPGGVAQLSLQLPGPGTLKVSATASRGSRPVPYGSLRTRARRAGSLRLALKPDARGRALLRQAGAAAGPGPVLTLTVTYTPTGGRPHELRASRIRLR